MKFDFKSVKIVKLKKKPLAVPFLGFLFHLVLLFLVVPNRKYELNIMFQLIYC